MFNKLTFYISTILIKSKVTCHNVDKISLIAYNTFIQININFYICGNNINN